MTQNNDHDFQQFRGAFDDATMPSDAFRTKMEKLLQSEKPVEPERTSTVLASPSKESSATVIPTRRSHPLMIAVAILMVFSVVIASVWVLSGDVLEGEYASAPSGIATLSADAPGTPGPDVQLTAERFSAISQVHDFFGMHGGLLIVRAPVELQENQAEPNQEPNVNSDVLMAIDPDTDEIVWEQPFYGFRAIDASNGVLIGLGNDWSASTPDDRQSLKILALDLSTGETIWSAAMDSGVGWSPRPSVVVVDDVVVELAAGNMAVARNLSDGKIVWETEYDPGVGWLQQYINHDDGKTYEEQWYTVATTAWNGNLVVINGDGLVQLLNADTGILTPGYQFDWPAADHTGSRNLVLHSMDKGLVLFQQGPEVGGFRTQLTAFDPDDGTHFWQLEMDGQVASDIEVAPNGNVAAQSFEWISSNWLQQLFGNHGQSIRGLTWIDGSSGKVRLTTEQGEVGEGRSGAATDGNYACALTGSDEISCYDRNGTRHIIDIEPQYNFDLVDGVLYVPTEDGLYRVELP